MEPTGVEITTPPELPLDAESGTLEAEEELEDEAKGRGEKRKLPDGNDDDGEGGLEPLTTREKRQRGIATLESPERTSEPREEQEHEAESPVNDPVEGPPPEDHEVFSWKAEPNEYAREPNDPWADPWGAAVQISGRQETAEVKVDDGAGNILAKDNVPESDDEWGDWGLSDKKEEDLMEQIRKQREETAAGWEREKWVPPTSDKNDETSDKGEEDADEQKMAEEAEGEQAVENWKGLFFTAPEDLADDEDETYWYNDLEHDAEWQMWPANSKEALAATVLVQKIRARAGREKTLGGPFPSTEVADLLQAYMSQPIQEQKVLLAALLWIETNVLEIKVLPPDLNEAIRMLLETESLTLKQVSQIIPNATLRTRAGSLMPTREVRKNSDDKVKKLITHLCSLLPAEVCGEEDQLTEMVMEELGHVPCTVRLSALVHLAELAQLKGPKVFRGLDDLVVALAKQRLPERAIESVCRLTLEMAIDLADNSMEASGDSEVRTEKLKVLRRLQKEWRVSPSEEHLAQLHMHKLETQLLFLLNIERDIEQFWVKMLSRAKSDEARAKEMANFLEFGSLLKPYLLEEPPNRRKPVTAECGQELGVIETARARSAASEVLKLLHSRYGWVPELGTRRTISRTHWIGRLSAMLTLACMPDCLHADAELRRLLAKEIHRPLGAEVLSRFQQWAKLEEGDGVIIKAPKVLDEATAEENRRLYKDFKPDPSKHPTAQGYQPATPGALGKVAAMPSTPAAPGTPARWMRAAGTPAGPPPAGAYRGAPVTPAGMGAPGTPVGRAPGTPSGPPPATPALHFHAPGTPRGPPPPTPATSGTALVMPAGFRNPLTPAGPPPATPAPAASGSSAPTTPAGIAKAGPPVPMTPAAAFASAPGTPRVPGAPSTPKDSGTTTPRHLPATPAEAVGRFSTQAPGAGVGPLGAAFRRMSATPVEALTGEAAGRFSTKAPGAGVGPLGAAFTRVSRLPSTPAAAFAGVSFAPQTPGGAVVPSTPAPGTGGAAPFTPVPGAAPFTPAPGAAPFTPAPAASAPMTPAVLRMT